VPTVQKRVSLAANSSVDNALSGSQYEYLPFPALVEIGLTTDANGVLTTIFSGPDVLAEEGPVQLGTINILPKYPDDFFYRDEAAPGDRLRIQLRDTSGATRIVMVSVNITPVG
jgi:hypothetical protein